MKNKKKCPNCNSTRVSIDANSNFYCKNCGFINSKIKKACLVDFEKYFR